MSIETPAGQGYRMPAEWEPQAAVWLAWPHNPETWPGDCLREVRETYAEVVRNLSNEQRVSLLVGDADGEREARQVLSRLGVSASGVTFLHLPTCDTWIRDYGPTFVVNRRERALALVSWEFNAWGNKYPEFYPDNDIPARMQRELQVPMFEPHIVMEGGAIDVNGAGLLLTTEQCLLNPNRNPGLDQGDVEQYLRDYLNISEILWLGEGIVGDDTDGHVDDVARFVGEDTVVCVTEVDPAEVNYATLKDNYERLTAFRTQTGKHLSVISLPMPAAVAGEGGPLPASYANFYIGNRTVLVPTFADPNDRVVQEILARCFPDRAVVGIDCRVLVRGLGTLHCCSQQEPIP